MVIPKRIPDERIRKLTKKQPMYVRQCNPPLEVRYSIKKNNATKNS